MAPFGAVWCCYFVTMGFYGPYAPLWLQGLGASTLAIGGLAALQNLTRLVSPYAWGWLADHGGRRVQLVQGAALTSAASAAALGLMSIQADRLGQSWLVAVTLGIAVLFLANSAVMPITEAIVLRQLHSRSGLDATRYGRARVGGSAGFLVASLSGGALLQAWGLNALPWLVGAFFLALAVAARWLPPSDPPLPAGEPLVPVRVWPILCRPELAWFFAGTALTVLAHTALYAFFSLYLVALGYSKALIGLIWAIGVLAEIAFFATQGRWLRRGTDLRWLHAVALVSAVRFALTAAVGQWLLPLLLVQCSHALTFAAHHSACTSVIARHFPDRLRGRGAALYTMLGYGVPGVIGGIAGGFLVEQAGLESVFWVASVVAIVAALCYRASAAYAPGRGAAIG